MRRFRLVLAAIAVIGWIGAGISQAAAIRSGNERWTVTRNRFLLCSSLAMNTLVFTAAYRFLERFRRSRRA